MKIQIASDLHLNTWHDQDPAEVLTPTGADALVLAGDTTSVAKFRPSLNLFTRLCTLYPRVICVPGNHEFWGTSVGRGWGDLLAIEDALKDKLTILKSGQVYNFGGYRWLGDVGWHPKSRAAPRDWCDVAAIRHHPAVHNEHRAFKAMLLKELTKGDIVVTHHIPTNKSVAPQYLNDPYTPYFVTPELEEFIVEREPRLWIHGHTHTHFDYSIGPTRVICNPRGYKGELTGFRPGLTIEI